MKKFETGRLEAFSDGVFAIAITLLVLELDLPGGSDSSVFELIQKDLPKFYSWVVSFFAIGALWLHHHYIVGQLRYADIAVLLLNFLLLLVISVTPWTTSLIGTYADRPVSFILFSGTLGVGWLLIALIAIYARRRGLLVPDAHIPEPGLITTLISVRGTLIAVLSIALSFFSGTLALLVWVTLFVMHPFVYHK